MAGINYTSNSIVFNLIKSTGGLNSTSSGLNVEDSESTDCQNIDFNKFGSILKRNGYTTLNDSAFNSGAGWAGLYWYVKNTTGVGYLVGVCGDKLAKMDDLDGTWDDITGALTITDNDDTQISWTTALDAVIGTNNVNVPFKWTGAGNGAVLDVPTDLTKAKFVEHWSNYTFLANVTVNATVYQTRIYWSNIDSITTWTDTDYRNVGNDDGQNITGLKALGDRLVIYKERSIWIAQFTGDSDIPFVFTRTQSNVGAESGYSICEVDNGHVFRSQDGYYYFDGLNSVKISDKISTTLQSYASTRAKYVPAVYQKSKNKYWAAESASGGSTHSKVVTWDSFNSAFSVYTGINANCFALVYYAGDERVYFGDYSGFVYRADYGADDYPAGTQTAIDAYYCTKWFNFDDLANKKGIPHVMLYHQIASTTLTFSYSYDFDSGFDYSQTILLGTSSDEWDTAIWDTATFAASGGAVKRVDLTGRGRVVRFKVSNAIKAETMQIDGFGMCIHLETDA